MARQQFFVVLHQNQWKVKYNDTYQGTFSTQKAAIRAAVELAHTARGDAQVLVQGENNRFRTEWTYGHDPYPPPG